MFLPVSEAVAKRSRLDSLPYRVIPNFLPASGAPDRTSPLLDQLPAGDFLLFAGDLRPDKGLSVLIDAYQRLDAPLPLVLIGRATAETPSSFPAAVHHLGSWPHAALMAAWERCYAAVLPSTWPEPFGIVLIEAMASGRPVVTSNAGAIPEIVTDDVSGLVTPKGDASALAAAMRRVTSDRALADRLGRAGREAAGRYAADAVVPRIEQVYRDLAKPVTSSESRRLVGAR